MTSQSYRTNPGTLQVQPSVFQSSKISWLSYYKLKIASYNCHRSIFYFFITKATSDDTFLEILRVNMILEIKMLVPLTYYTHSLSIELFPSTSSATILIMIPNTGRLKRNPLYLFTSFIFLTTSGNAQGYFWLCVQK